MPPTDFLLRLDTAALAPPSVTVLPQIGHAEVPAFALPQLIALAAMLALVGALRLMRM